MTTVPAPDDGIDDPPALERTPEVEPSVEVGRGRRRGRITRIAGAIGVLVLTGAVAAAGFAVPAPADVAVAPLTVDVPPAAQTLVCAGALTRPAGIGAGDSAFNPTPVDAISEVRAVSVAPAGAGAAPAGTLKPLAGGTTLKGLGPTGAKAEALRAAGITGASVLRADPVGDQPPRAAAASASVTTAGDLRGLAAASCQEPAADQWLVGGSTELGNSATLVVANSGATAADVSVELFGPSGAVDLAGSAAFLVAPGAERALLLEGVAAEQKRIAVHVSAAGGLITAHVQDSRLDGFTPAGVDLVSAGPGPAARQVVGGIVVATSTIDAPDAAALRLLVPGATGSTARISLLGPAGLVTLPGADTIKLAAGEVTDVSLGGLPAGAYTAVIDADEPVVAAAMITRTGLPGALDDRPTLERAWSAAAVPGAEGAVAVPSGVSGTVLLTAIGTEADGAGKGAATGLLRAIGADGGILTELEVSVQAGTTTAITVDSLAPGQAIAGVDLSLPRPDAAASGKVVLGWSVLATVAAADGEFVSVLAPVASASAPPSVNVREARSLGRP